VAAWNRTPARAEALAVDGVTPIPSIQEAVASSRLVIACTMTYETTRVALEPVVDWHARSLVNLATGSRAEAMEMARWASDRGARYLDGAVTCYPDDIGDEATALFYAGSSAAWAEHEPVLRLLGEGSLFASEQVDVANLMLAAGASFYIGALSAYVEAVTLLHDLGLAPADVLRIGRMSIELLSDHAAEAIEAIDTGKHQTDQAALTTFAETARSTLPELREAGYRFAVLGAALELMQDAESAGLGHLDFYAMSRVTR
jgi:3-hydroxyisobutyrate dehydrogenase-like beta-hydroxyacid dehydrogenase